jgi:thiamine-phosphate pyrophosphorylase
MLHKLPRGLYALIDDGLRPELPPEAKALAAVQGGAQVLQLRLKRASDRQALRTVREVVALARERQVPVIVNDRVDLCLAGGAQGVHLGADDLPPAVARALLGPEALLGVTARSLEDIAAAAAEGADHVGLGPIFPTTTKAVDAPALGLAGFAAIAARSPLPVVGIAGVSLDTIGQVAAAGAWCAAVGRDLLLADDLAARARQLQAAFSAGRR